MPSLLKYILYPLLFYLAYCGLLFVLQRHIVFPRYQIPQPFAKMSVFENLLVAAVHGGGLRERQARGEPWYGGFPRSPARRMRVHTRADAHPEHLRRRRWLPRVACRPGFEEQRGRIAIRHGSGAGDER